MAGIANLEGALLLGVSQTFSFQSELGQRPTSVVISNDDPSDSFNVVMNGETYLIQAGEVREFTGVETQVTLVLTNVSAGSVSTPFRAVASTGAVCKIVKPNGGPVGTDAIANGAVTQAKMKVRGLTALVFVANDVTLTAAIMLGANITSCAPVANSTVTMDTGTNIETMFATQGTLAVGSCFDFSIANTAPFNAVLTVAAGITLLGAGGSFLLNSGMRGSGSFRATRTAANAYTVVSL